MRAVHIDNGVVEVRQHEIPHRPEGHALLKLLLAGICNTDLELKRGYYGFRGVPGHEFVAEVVEACNSAWIGKRVVGEINLGCQSCDWCGRGLSRHCPHRTVLGIVRQPGAFRDYLTLPEANLFEVPDSIATEEAVFTEPLAAACEILDQIEIQPGADIAVLGDGKLGLLIAQTLQAHGANVTLLGRHPDKLAIARNAGIETVLESKDVTGRKYPITVDATGSPAGLSQAIAITQPRGTVMMKSTVTSEVAIPAAAVIVDEITLVGSRCGRFAPALKLLENRRVRVLPLIEQEFNLSEAAQAFAAAETKGVRKILLRP